MDTRRIFEIESPSAFEGLALEIFRYQHEYNPVYREYCTHLGIHASEIAEFRQIPYLPVSFFKSKKVRTGSKPHEIVFSSSGTTAETVSHHYVADTALYEQSYLLAFERFYGPPEDYCILALLPSYLERGGSSLVHMAAGLIRKSGHPESGFYLDDLALLKKTLLRLEATATRVLLLGVSFALLDFASRFPMQLKHTLVMETGGMKGRGKELVRDELHQRLCKGLGVDRIHSEYGMTELLSQAYSEGEGRFRTPSWMRIRIRDTEDPLSAQPGGQTGGVDIADLANLHSCSFIATQDLGKTHADGSFEILGRFDHSDIRGCNLMAL